MAQQLTRSLSSRSSSGGAARATCCKSLSHSSGREQTASQPAAFAGAQCIPVGRSTSQQPCTAAHTVMMHSVPEARALLRAASQVLQQPLLQHQEAHSACSRARASMQMLCPQSKQDQGSPLYSAGGALQWDQAVRRWQQATLCPPTWRQIHQEYAAPTEQVALLCKEPADGSLLKTR